MIELESHICGIGTELYQQFKDTITYWEFWDASHGFRYRLIEYNCISDDQLLIDFSELSN